MKFSQISKVADLLKYAKAEYADAQRYCNKTATLAIYSQAVAYLQGLSSGMSSSDEAYYVNIGKSMIESARTQWYNDGCAAPGSSSSSASKPSDSTSSGGSESSSDDSDSGSSGSTQASIWGPLLLAGLGLLAVWYFTKDKKGAAAPKQLTAGKTAKRRRTTASKRRR